MAPTRAITETELDRPFSENELLSASGRGCVKTRVAIYS